MCLHKEMSFSLILLGPFSPDYMSSEHSKVTYFGWRHFWAGMITVKMLIIFVTFWFAFALSFKINVKDNLKTRSIENDEYINETSRVCLKVLSNDRRQRSGSIDLSSSSLCDQEISYTVNTRVHSLDQQPQDFV